MTPKELSQARAVIQAHADEKEIECCLNTSGQKTADWGICTNPMAHTVWQLAQRDMVRVKPEPKLEPYTSETFPLRAQWFQWEDGNRVSIVSVKREGFLIPDSHRPDSYYEISFADLLKEGDPKGDVFSFNGEKLRRGVEVKE